MNPTIDAIPWNRRDVWQAANASLNHTIEKNWPALDESRHLAHGLQLHLTALFPIMDRLCQTCARVAQTIAAGGPVCGRISRTCCFTIWRTSPFPINNCSADGERIAAMQVPTAACWIASSAPLSAPGTCARHKPDTFEKRQRK